MKINKKLGLLAMFFCLCASTLMGIVCFNGNIVSADVLSPKITQAYVTMSNNIIVNYEVENIPLEFSEVTMRFTYKNEAFDVTTQVENQKAVFKFDKITPQYFGENVKAELIVNDLVVATQETFSVKTYCYALLNSSAEDLSLTNREYDSMQRLVVDFLYYGDASQIYTGVNTDSLATSELTEQQKMLKSDFVAVDSTDYTVGADNSSMIWYGYGLRFDYNISFYVEFALKAEPLQNLTVRFSKESNAEQSIEAVPYKTVKGYTIYKAVFYDISATDFDKVITATVYDGETKIDNSITYSVKTFVYDYQNVTERAEMAKAVFAYENSAIDYRDINVVTSIAIDEEKTATYYELNDNLKSSEIIVTYKNGDTENLAITSDMLSEFETSSYGAKSFIVEYGEKQCNLNIKVGYNVETDSYKLINGIGEYKVQIENDSYFDMSEAVLQTGTVTKFENLTKNSSGVLYANGAEGSSTCNISVKNNKIIMSFYSEVVGEYSIGLRGQSGSSSGQASQDISQAIALKVNNSAKTITGTLEKACVGTTNWIDMTNWTILTNIASDLELVKGLNTIEISFLGETATTMRFPNLDYMTINLEKIYQNPSILVEGTATVQIGNDYTDGLTLIISEEGQEVGRRAVTKDMISGFNNSVLGEQQVTVTYLGKTTQATITVTGTPHVLTLTNGNFIGGGTSCQLYNGFSIPEIEWSVTGIIGYNFNGTLYTDIALIKMADKNSTLKAITASEATKTTLTDSFRYNNGTTSQANGTSNYTLTSTTSTMYLENDAKTFTVSNVIDTARGMTFRANINFGSGEVLVHVAFINNGTVNLQNIKYNTEKGTVDLGNVSAGATKSASAIVIQDGANHWTHLHWDGQITSLSCTIAIYVYKI